MPYLYTLADEASRTGIPMVRPLFMEFPDATPDRHPIDIDVPAASEFMLGPALLIAPRSYPDEQGPYNIELPRTVWYDFWTGEKIATPAAKAPIANDPAAILAASATSLTLTHELGKLPVFVRAGSILPIAPVVQNTETMPAGPLTLRIYAGAQCRGNLYNDDGKTYEYQRGAYLRVSFQCNITPESMSLTIGAHEGSFPAWWKEMHVEIYGWSPARERLQINGKESTTALESRPHGFAFNVADPGKGVTIQLE